MVQIGTQNKELTYKKSRVLTPYSVLGSRNKN